MKRILLFIILLLCVCSCALGEKTSSPNIVVEKITYEQHDYLLFYAVPGHFTGVEHDPNCWCMIDYD